MRTFAHYPADATRGSCFVTGRYELEPGERVVWLDVDMLSLPQHGQLCLSELAVRMMLDTLGWELLGPEFEQDYDALLKVNIELRDQVKELTKAVIDIVDVAALKRATEVVERRAGDKADIDAWAKTLESAK